MISPLHLQTENFSKASSKMNSEEKKDEDLKRILSRGSESDSQMKQSKTLPGQHVRKRQSVGKSLLIGQS